MATKFVLNTGQLNTDYLSTPSTLVFDATNRGKLDQNLLSSGTAIVVNNVATSNLGNLNSIAVFNISDFKIAQALFGSLNSNALANINHFLQGTSNLQTLNSNIQTTIKKNAIAQSNFESLSSQGFLGIVHNVSGESTFGGLNAAGTATHGIPPEPEPQYGSRGNYLTEKIKPKIKKKAKIEKPVIPKIIEITPQPKTIIKNTDPLVLFFNANAKSQIDFSVLQDEADLLLIL
jgi:hypothetical protein